MSLSNFIPHHLFVSAVGRPARGQRKPGRDLLDSVRLTDQALVVPLELLDVDKKRPRVEYPLQVLSEAS
jgi:hypothetical protein